MTHWWHRLSCYFGRHDYVVKLKYLRVPLRRRSAVIEVETCSRCGNTAKVKHIGWARLRKK